MFFFSHSHLVQDENWALKTYSIVLKTKFKEQDCYWQSTEVTSELYSQDFCFSFKGVAMF